MTIRHSDIKRIEDSGIHREILLRGWHLTGVGLWPTDSGVEVSVAMYANETTGRSLMAVVGDDGWEQAFFPLGEGSSVEDQMSILDMEPQR